LPLPDRNDELRDLIGSVNAGTGAERLTVQGDIRVGTGTNGCVQDADGTVISGVCSSDLRFKKDVTSFSPTLERFARLKPVNYFWRASEFADRRFGTRPSWSPRGPSARRSRGSATAAISARPP
jgi:hypothetical protein